MLGAVAYLLLGIIDYTQYTAIIRYCDVIELNHSYEDTGIVYDQVIFWEYENGKKIAITYKVLERRRKCSVEEKIAQKKFYEERHVKLPINFKYTIWLGVNIERTDDEFYTFIFLDGEILRIIKAPSFIESWTPQECDPEMINRKVLQKENRKGLIIPRIYRDYYEQREQNGLFTQPR